VLVCVCVSPSSNCSGSADVIVECMTVYYNLHNSIVSYCYPKVSLLFRGVVKKELLHGTFTGKLLCGSFAVCLYVSFSVKILF
jgi:hypothetical protein